MTRDPGERLTVAGLGMPEATGSRRMDWAAMPREATARIERMLGSPVAHAISQRGGFSEGLAARVRLENGKRAFIKAASSLMAPAEADFHRREIAVSEQLPGEVPAPRLLDAYDDGTWVVLAFEEIPGQLPAQPWRREELNRVLAADRREPPADPRPRPRSAQRGARPARRVPPADRCRGRTGRRSPSHRHDDRAGSRLAAVVAEADGGRGRLSG
ncbi:hypothetical protein GCM10009548_59420 [Streptomyces malaysiensis subsp. malaysiensis]